MNEHSHVDTYIGLDFSRGCDNVRSLNDEQALSLEVSSGDVKLSDVESAGPIGLTPHMAAWYMEHVQPFRRNALNQIDAIFKGISENDSAGAVLLGRRLDEIEQQETLGKRKARKLHWEQYSGDFDALKNLKSSRDSAQQTYDRKRKERNNQPPKMIKWWYWLLLALVGVSEILVNYDSFTAIKLLTPATALGTAIVVAALIALSSHFIGTIYAQHRAYFKDATHENDKGHAIRWYSIGIASLWTALGVVGYSRYYFFMDIVKQWEVLGGDKAPSMLPIIGGSLGTNMVVWFIGVCLAFLLHDRDPKFPGQKMNKDKSEKEYRKKERELSKGLDTELKRISAKADEERKYARSLDQSMQSKTEYRTARALLDNLSENDTKVMSLLQGYKNKFSQLAKQKNTQIFHHKDDVSLLDNGKQTQSLSSADYAGLSLSIRYL